MASENFTQQITWLTSRFHTILEMSPTEDSVVELYNIDKFGSPVTSTGRTYKGSTLVSAIDKAYEQEQKLAKS